MIKTIPPFLLLAAALGTPVSLWANETGDAMLGGALGGALGAAMGSELGGRNGAILGGAIGGATGTAMTTRRYRSQPNVIYVDRPVYGPRRDYGPPPGYYRHHDQRRGPYRHRHDWE